MFYQVSKNEINLTTWKVKLIDNDFASTAAQCFQNKGFSTISKPESVNALIGRYNLSDSSERGSKTASVQEIILHPDWKYDNDKFDADIAIVVLSEAVAFTNKIKPVYLPSSTNLAPEGLGTVVGWGKSSVETEYDETLNKLEMPAVNASYCYTRYPRIAEYSSHRTFCAGFENEERGACTGDGGGGFFMKSLKEHSWSVNGIASAALSGGKFGCDVNVFGIYTNVALFKDWIMEKMENTNTNYKKVGKV